MWYFGCLQPVATLSNICKCDEYRTAWLGLRPAYLVRLACPVQFWYCLNIMVNLVQLNYPLWQGFFLSNFINCYGFRSLCMWLSMITLIIIQNIDKWYQLAPPLTCLWRKEWLLFLWELICADLETVLLFSFKSFLVDQLIYYWIFYFLFFLHFFNLSMFSKPFLDDK